MMGVVEPASGRARNACFCALVISFAWSGARKYGKVSGQFLGFDISNVANV